MSKYNPKYIDDEERDIMESVESIDVAGLKPSTKAEQEKFKSAAKDFMRNNTKMNIRIVK